MPVATFSVCPSSTPSSTMEYMLAPIIVRIFQDDACSARRTVAPRGLRESSSPSQPESPCTVLPFSKEELRKHLCCRQPGYLPLREAHGLCASASRRVCPSRSASYEKN